MDSSHGKMRMDVGSDRLSSLPDDLIHKILSFIDIREAIGTSALSSRWRLIWTSLPYLNFSIGHFSTLPKFSKFVTHVLSRRNNLAEVYSMKLEIRVKESLLFLKRILKYAFSHNIQHLDVVFELEKASDSLLSLFTDQPLKHLGLTMRFYAGYTYCLDSFFASTSGLPTLTTLALHSVSSDNADKWINFVSKCANLKNLTLEYFKPLSSSGLSICHPQLSSLTLDYIRFDGVVNIDAPQLKNLNIISCRTKFVISAPDLASLLYKGSDPSPLTTEGFHSLEKADICFPYTEDADIHGIVFVLQLLHNVKFLTLSLGIVELLCSSMDLILPQPSPFVNLKSLRIFPETTYSLQQPPMKVTIMSTKVKSYLLDGSPDSTFTMVLREDIQENQAQKLMAEIRVCLETEKDNYETYRAHLESYGPKKLETGGDMTQIESGWENLVEQLQRRKENGCLIMSKLQSVEKLLTKLPPSNRAKIEPSFSSLCAEVDIAISMITDFMKIQCDEKSKLFKSVMILYKGRESGEGMNSGYGKMRMNLEGDRLSSLPDDLIHKILSFVDIREAIGTSVLSSRWRHIWTSLPYLNFPSVGFYKLPKFSKFVTNVLSHRNNLTDVYSMKLRIRVKDSLLFVKRILKYAFSHNIQHLDVEFVLEKASDSLLSLFTDQPLKHLGLTMQFDMGNMYISNSCFASTSGLPTLTSLNLHSVSSYNVDKWINFFSNSANLKNLTLKDFNLFSRPNGLSICHPQLSSLTLESIHFDGVVNIDAPQLKNLTIRSCNAKVVISAPVLAFLLYNGYGPLPLSTNGFHSLETADICFSCGQDADIDGIVCLLQLLHNVKFLTLNLEIVERLSSSMDLILQQPSPFAKLKSLKICPERTYSLEPAPKKVTVMSTEVKGYLLGGSSGCTLTMVLREEVLAQKLMDEIRVYLKKEKDNYDPTRAHLERGKTPVESHEPKKPETGGNTAQIKSGWEDMVDQLQRRKENGCRIMSKLQSIEELLIKLPPSNRKKMLPSVASLFVEVYIAISMITDCMKIQCDEKSKLFKSLLS